MFFATRDQRSILKASTLWARLGLRLLFEGVFSPGMVLESQMFRNLIFSVFFSRRYVVWVGLIKARARLAPAVAYPVDSERGSGRVCVLVRRPQGNQVDHVEVDILDHVTPPLVQAFVLASCFPSIPLWNILRNNFSRISHGKYRVLWIFSSMKKRIY
jgi:hypothetical protein